MATSMRPVRCFTGRSAVLGGVFGTSTRSLWGHVMAGSVREQDEGDRRGLAAVRGEIGCGPDRRLGDARTSLRILFLVSAHNSLSQRAWIALTELGHEVTVAIVDSAAAMEAAVDEHRPQLIVCPMLKTMIPESIWAKASLPGRAPGAAGDRGPSSLDWAIELGAPDWGVTVLEANGEPDAGDVWATRDLPRPRGGQEQPVSPRGPPGRDRGARRGDGQDRRRRRRPAPSELGAGRVRPGPPADDPGRAGDRLGRGRHRRACSARSARPRATPGSWTRSGHGVPSLRRAPGARAARAPGGDRRPAHGRDLPGDGRRRGVDHAPQAPRHAGGALFKLPATRALALAGPRFDAPEIPVAVDAPLSAGQTYREIAYEEEGGVGYLHFDFYNGAMSTEQCRRLHEAFLLARSRRADEGHRAHGRQRLLLQRHPPQRHRGRRRPRRRVVEQPPRHRRPRPRDHRHRLAPRALRARRRRRRGRRALRARGRLRGRPRGRRPEPVLRAHGRPLRLGVLDLPAAAPGRRRAAARLTGAAVHARGHPPGGRDGADRRRVRGHPGRLSLPGPRAGRAARAGPGRRSLAGGKRPGVRATRRQSHSTPIAAKSWPARTRASSARTAATTRRASASSTSSALRAPSRRRPRCPRTKRHARGEGRRRQGGG